ncbi:MAG: hypothetical protein NTZ84_03370 [Candidatus Nealsonbacteria bacterium]|nr:hypothetical protein [Candidatus Nealsonbacteria bacterium]
MARIPLCFLSLEDFKDPKRVADLIRESLRRYDARKKVMEENVKKNEAENSLKKPYQTTPETL